MGTDIDIRIERLNRQGHWELVPFEGPGQPPFPPVLLGRNYALFGLLAGVRERLPVNPIAMDRGLPPGSAVKPGDVDAEEYGVSWVGLEELEAYPWDQPLYESERLLCAECQRRLPGPTARTETFDWAGEVLPWLQTLAQGRPLRLVFGFNC